MSSDGDLDSPVRIVVTPAQSSYFAGEPFAVTITFTNTRSPSSASGSVGGGGGGGGPSRSSHKRGAHSISSAPLSRPPTSPGLPPRSAAPPQPPASASSGAGRARGADEVHTRKGLIGKPRPSLHPGPPQNLNSGDVPELIEQRRKRQLQHKSLSVSVLSPVQFLEEQLGEGGVVGGYATSRGCGDIRHAPPIPSPLARTDSFPLAPTHPHARKLSVMDGGQFSLDVSSPSPSKPTPTPSSPLSTSTSTSAPASASTSSSPSTPNASTSTFSLALDPIAEGATSPYASTPAIGSPTIEQGSFSFSFSKLSGDAPTPTQAPTPMSAPASNAVYGYPPARAPPPIGLGNPPGRVRGYPPASASATSSAFPPIQTPFPSAHLEHPQPTPTTELILYSYAQLAGSLLLTPVPGAQPTKEQAALLRGVRRALVGRGRGVLGGGRMDIGSVAAASGSGVGGVGGLGVGGGGGGLGSPRGRGGGAGKGHARASSFSAAGLLSILSPTGFGFGSPTGSGSGLATSTSTSTSATASTRWRSASSATPTPTPTATPTSGKFPGSVSSPSSLGSGLGLGLGFGFGFGSGSSSANGISSSSTSTNKISSINGNGIPSAKDEDIDPEEPLPTFEVQPAVLAVDLALAPGESRSYTYSIKLPDNLPPTFRGKALQLSYELVVGTCRASGGGNGISVSRVMKVPIRVYNHVSVARVMKPYDILWPVGRRQDAGMRGTGARVVEGAGAGVAAPSSSLGPATATTDTKESIREYALSLLGSVPDSNRGDELRRREKESERERVEEGSRMGCREAVEILTRVAKKASYDVTKDGVRVAVLTFPKSAYRLGETVTGVVELNEGRGRARVVKMSAILESHETLPSSVSPSSSARHLRRAHAEAHASFVLNTLRTTFSLVIPSDASPAFQVRVGTTGADMPGGLEWKVRLCLLVGMAGEGSYVGAQGGRFKGVVRDGARGEWGSSWRATAGNAPMEKPGVEEEVARTWSLSSIFYGSGEREYHDGDVEEEEEEEYDGIIPDAGGGVGVGVDYGAGDKGWREVRLETVECEVPVRVYAGNTAFKAADVVFDV